MCRPVRLIYLSLYFYLNHILVRESVQQLPVITRESKTLSGTKLSLPSIKVVQERQSEDCSQDQEDHPITLKDKGLNLTVSGSKLPLPCTDDSDPAFTSAESEGINIPCNPISLFVDRDHDLESKVCYKPINTTFADNFEDGEYDVTTILGKPGDRLKFKCISSYLTRWTTTILPTKEATYTESRRYDQSPFEKENLTFVNEFDLIIQEGNSGWIRCENFNISTIKAEIFVFSQDGPDLVGDEDEVEEVVVADLNAYLKVPCVANYPTVEARLEEETDHFRFEPVNISRLLKPYDSRFGFLVQGRNESEQTYRCISNGQSVIFNLFYSNTTQKHSGISGRTTATGQMILYTESSITKDKVIDKRGDIFCRLNATENSDVMFLKMIRCSSPIQCDWLSICFQKCWLSHDVERQEITRTSAIAFLNNPFPTGIIVCVLPQENLGIVNYYFTGLDRLSYFINDPIPPGALIKLETSEQQFYTYQSTEFLCGISSFLLVSNIKFAATFKNKTKILLGNVNSHGDENIEEYGDRGFSQRKIYVNLTKEMTAITCMAPYYNSSDWMTSTIEFDSKDVLLPSIDQSLPNGKFVETIFRRGEVNQILHCSAQGDPKPEIHWVFPNEHVASTIKHPQSIEGESTLIFPAIEDYTFQGSYICNASSQFGSATQEMRVTIKDSSLTTEELIGVACAILIFVAIITTIIFLGFKYYAVKDGLRDLTDDEIREFNHGLLENEEVQEDDAVVPTQVEAVGPEEAKQMAFKKSYVIEEKDLIIAKNAVLGSGEFGMVYRGFLNGEAVAVKTTKSNADVAFVKSFLAELKIMAYIGNHPHVVHFRGAVVNRIKERIVYCVVELCPLGNLHSYLRKVSDSVNYENIFMETKPEEEDLNTKCDLAVTVDPETVPRKPRVPRVPRKLQSQQSSSSNDSNNGKHTSRNLINWCKQIAEGMDYLAEKKVIHGDLAARNVLVFKNEVMKITDFGLSKQLYQYSKYVRKQQMPLPWRWLALESLKYLEFSSQSDVWSFGITMWEIFSFGETPYPGRAWTTDFFNQLGEGLRPQRPKNTPKAVYALMQQCWQKSPLDRPRFKDLKTYLESL